MSNALAISAVTAVLQHYLSNVYSGLSALFGGNVALSSKAPDIVQTEIGNGAHLQNQVNVFLHQVTHNAGWRNVGLASVGADGKTQLNNPPLALDLHYLLTAYGSNDWQAEALLGHALLLLHQNPIVSRDDIRAALAALPLSDPGNPLSTALGLSGLADQIEMIKITPSTLGREEMAWLWTALKADYRPTFPFQVSVVLLQTEKSLSFAFPVLSRNIGVHPIQLAQILAVTPPKGQVAAAPGDTVTVTGEFLKGATQVQLVNQRLAIQTTVPAAAVTNTSLTFTVPVETALNPFPAGIYTLAILFTDAASNILQTTASLSLAVAPVLHIVPPPTVVKSVTETLVTILCNPKVQPSQTAYLSIGSFSAPAQRFEVATATLTFQFVPPLPNGSQLARLVVDESPGQIDVNWVANPPTFLGPKVTI
jgi:hypothetical protein